MAAKALLCVGPFGLEETLRPDQQTTLPLLIDVLTIAIGLRECQTSQAQGEEQIKNFRRSVYRQRLGEIHIGVPASSRAVLAPGESDLSRSQQLFLASQRNNTEA